jgi:hypothetical protein
MTLETYLAIALAQMGTDAFATHLCRERYRVVPSLLLALVWPLTALIIIIGAAVEPPTEKRKTAAKNRGERNEEED